MGEASDCPAGVNDMRRKFSRYSHVQACVPTGIVKGAQFSKVEAQFMRGGGGGSLQEICLELRLKPFKTFLSNGLLQEKVH
jgi:hypothetical protein